MNHNGVLSVRFLLIQDKGEVMIKGEQREGRASQDKNHTTLTKARACQWKNNYGLNYG